VLGVTGELQRARVAVSVVFAVCGAGFATWAARIPAVQDQLGLSTGQLSIGLFGLAAGSVLALLASGPVITMVGSRVAALVGASVLCAGLPLVALAPSLSWFVGALVVLGAGNSLLDVSMNAHAARVEAGYGRPIFAGFHAFWNIGGLIGSGAAALAGAQRVAVEVHFSWSAALLVGLALWATTREFLRGRDQGQGEAVFALPSRALLALGVIAFCGFLAEGTVNDWSAAYLADVTGSTGAFASLGYFVFSTTMIAVRLVTDRLVVRVGVVAFTRVAAGTTLAGFALLVLVPTPAAALAAFAVIGLGVAAIVPLAWSSAGQKEPASPGRAIAAVAICGYLGFLLGPVLIGALAELIGLRWAVGAAALTIGAVYVLAPTMRVPAPAPTADFDTRG
jgi:MFS family permease